MTDEVKMTEDVNMTEEVELTEDVKDEPVEVPTWSSLGLDQRILAALAQLGWPEPTEIQEVAIPLALKGKNIVARAKTGSGKTGAFCLPIIQKLLHNPTSRAIIVCPSRELSAQTAVFVKRLSVQCSDIVSLYELGQESDETVTDSIGAAIVCGTPGRFVKAISAGRLDMGKVDVLVLDEADLLFGFGHEQVLRELIQHLPGHQQTMLMSATLSENVDIIKKLTMKRHVTLKLAESSLPSADALQHYHCRLDADFDKFLITLAMLKLKLVRGKSLVFVCGTNRGYKLKLFFKQFGVSAVILSSELDAKSRQNAVLQFNKGRYDVLIANDQADIDEVIQEGEHIKTKQEDKKNTQKAKTDLAEFGLSRGIDFQHVSNVINFDFPSNEAQYVHRAGRTARAGTKGRVISLTIGEDERVSLMAVAELHSVKVEPFKFSMNEVDGLKMRAREALDLCTKRAVRDCRVAEIRQSLLNSQRLQEDYFVTHESDLLALRHDAKLKKIPGQSFATLPDYLVPKQVRQIGSVNKGKRDMKRRNLWKKNKSDVIKAKRERKKEDPLSAVKVEKASKK